MQEAVKAGKLTYADLTLYFLARIQQYDETLRTMVELNPNALKEAQAADALRKQGKAASPMLGIPVTLKDNIETAAPMRTTSGAEILLKNQPKADASFVKQLRDAGAVILGKANLSELAGGIMLMPAGVSAVGGQVHNPHGNYSPAGSSAGSGAGKADVLVSVNNYHSAFYATANYPAISVPLGLRKNGMPAGVTLIGKPGSEAKLLSYAYALEQATKLRVDPDLSKVVAASTEAPSATTSNFSSAWQSVSCDAFNLKKDIAESSDCGYVTVPVRHDEPRWTHHSTWRGAHPQHRRRAGQRSAGHGTGWTRRFDHRFFSKPNP